MKKSATTEQSYTDNLKLLGDFWTLQIIGSLADCGKRYCEIQRHLDNMNPVTLADRLKKLEQAGLIDRREETEDKIAVSYSLTDRGRQALPVLTAIDAFSTSR